MKKKIVLLLLIGVVLGGIGFFLFSKQQSIVNTTLSQRSREYLEKRQNNTDSSLQYVNLDEKGETTNKTHTVRNCFRLMIPFKVGIIRFEKTCEGYFQILNPNGRVLAYIAEDYTPDPDQMEGIGMRRKFPDLYAEEKKVINNREFLIFSRKDSEAYDKNVYYHTPSMYFVLNLSGSDGQNLDEKLFAMLASIEFLQN